MLKTNLKTITLVWLLSLPLGAAEFYVSPTGSASGDGSLSRPWDLQTALNHPSSVRGGDTIWLRGGLHRRNSRPTLFTSRLSGSSSARITVRQYPGERATIDGALQQSSGGYVNYWGFEVTCTYANRTTSQSGSSPTINATYNGQTINVWVTAGLDVRAPGIRLINMVVHDVIGNGVFLSTAGPNPEVYGTLSYYNGWQGSDRGHGHAIYCQSQSPSSPKIHDNIFFGNYGLGFHAYGTAAPLDNFDIQGNACFYAGIISSRRESNFLLGRESGYANNPLIVRNFIYDTSGAAAVNLGYVSGISGLVLRSNYFQTSVTCSSLNTGSTISGNTFLGGVSGISQSSYPNNTYSTARPTANLVEVRPNKYEPGRANIIIYNWQSLSTVPVNVSQVLDIGDAFEVRNAMDFYGAPVLSGVYNGGAINLPMTGLTVARPNGDTAPPNPAPSFAVFVLLPKAGGTSSQPPVISSIPSQATDEDTQTAPIPFTVTDADTAAANLTLSAGSSNPTLVPTANVTFGGTGSSRTLTIRPTANQFGTATITVSVSDGVQSVSTSFTLTVNPVNDAPTISTIANATVQANTATAPLPFTVGDLDSAANTLTLLSSSSNPTLLPNANIVFGGSGSNRTVTLTPARDQTGTATITLSLSDGGTTVLRSFDLTVISNTPPQRVSLTLEAEAMTLTLPMQAMNDAETVWVLSSTANQGTVSFTFNAPTTDSYVVWCRVLAQSWTSDSFFVGLDGAAEDVFDAAEGTWTNAWQWVRLNGRGGGSPLALNPRVLTLTAGTHTLVFRGREAQAGLDKIVVSNDPNFTPAEVVQPTPVTLTLEAEAGTLASPMSVQTDAQNSAVQFVATTTGEQGTVSFNVNIPKAGTYTLWAKVLASSFNRDSFYVSVDGAEDVFDAAEGTWSSTWQWSRLNGRAGSTPLSLNPRTCNFTAGNHTIVFRGREANAGLDKIVITSDPTVTPQ